MNTDQKGYLRSSAANDYHRNSVSFMWIFLFVTPWRDSFEFRIYDFLSQRY